MYNDLLIRIMSIDSLVIGVYCLELRACRRWEVKSDLTKQACDCAGQHSPPQHRIIITMQAMLLLFVAWRRVRIPDLGVTRCGLRVQTVGNVGRKHRRWALHTGMY